MDEKNQQALAVLKQHGRSFYFASHLLGAQHTSRAARLYAFCRHVDDLVDEADNLELAGRHIQTLQDDLLTGQTHDPLVMDMIQLMQEIRIPAAPVLSLIEGVQSDLTPCQFQNESELMNYAYQVAGTVGLMMCKVLDVDNPKAWPFAIDLGIAMQLTNIARDVGEDAARGRVYLPGSWIGQMNAEKISKAQGQDARLVHIAQTRILQLAETYYQSGLSGLVYLPAAARYGILVAAVVYREIGKLVLETGPASLQKRAVVPAYRKLVCAAGAVMKYLLKQVLKSSSSSMASAHQPQLHQHLSGCFGSSTHERHDTA